MRYSRYRHKALRTTGHLFERRYRAKLVDVDAYFLTLLRYIHLNPVKARIVSSPADYPWSSHRAYLGLESLPWLTTDFGLSLFSDDLLTARQAYEQFIRQWPADGKNLEDESHPEDPRVLGTDAFLNSIPFIPFRPRGTLTLEHMAKSICDQHMISLELLRSPSRPPRNLAPIRLALAEQAVDQRIATLCEVARFLHRDASSLTKLIARHTAKK